MSSRQIDMLQAMADGLTLVEIAREWKLSRQMAKNQAKAIRAFLGADTNPQAVAMGIRRGLID